MDLAVIRHEVVGGVLRGDPALQREAVQRNLFLRRQAHRLAEQLQPLRHLNLAAHQIDARDHLGDRVLHLDARIHLDEVPGARIGIHQELHGSGVVIAGRARQLDGGLGQRAADRIVQPHRGRHLDDLLMPPLHRAIAFIEVQQVAGAIAQDLHFDVAGALDVAFQEYRIVAEGRARLALRFRQPLAEFRRPAHHAHAAPAAAEGRLHD